MVTYILIHGAYHGAWCWDEIKKILENKGNEVYALDMPGHSDSRIQKIDVNMQSYIDCVVDFIKNNNLKNVILVGHSFAGTYLPKIVEMMKDNVKKLILIAALILDNQSMFDVKPETKEKYTAVAMAREDRSRPAEKDIFIEKFCNGEDLDIHLKLTPEPLKPYTEKINIDKFKKLNFPVMYIKCLKDQVVNPELTDKMIKNLSNIEVIEFNGHHEAIISEPDKITEIILRN